MSFVSTYNQKKANNEIKGIEANKPPENEFFFANSEIKSMEKAEMINFNK